MQRPKAASVDRNNRISEFWMFSVPVFVALDKSC